VALILTIVVVMREDGDPTDNFSVSVTGVYTEPNDGDETGNSYPSDMYYCVGENCQFHGHDVKDTFPGYYALVGFSGDNSDGKAATWVIEHSIGKVFEYEGDTLKSCYDSADIDSDALTTQVSAMTSNHEAGSTTFALPEGGSYEMYTYTLNADPSTDSPSVRGKTVPTLEACKAVWSNEDSLACAAAGIDCSDPHDIEEADVDETAAAEDLSSGGRRLWGGGGSHNAHTLSQLASFAYDGNLPGGWTHWTTCINHNSKARFAYQYPTMVLAWAGTDDFWDALQDLKTWGHSKYHGGFWDYVSMTYDCVQNRVSTLAGWGIQLDYITGHSLGGAATTVYKQRSGNGAKAVTFAAPKTTRDTACASPGVRYFDEKDPVASNGLGILGAFNHDISSAVQLYRTSSWYCSRRWWGRCVWWSQRDNYSYRGVGCRTEAGGCSWFFDCLWNVGRHSLTSYQKHGLGRHTP
jgi:hypothetical protein